MPSPTPAPRESIATVNRQKPTRKRYWVVVFALTLAILSYIDRVCLSVAAPRVKEALNLTEQERGAIFAAFGLAYALFEIPGGFMGDWMGPKKVLIRIVLWWSAFTAAIGWMWSFTSLWIAQFLFGAGEAGCFPNLTKAFSAWLRREERVRVQGYMWSFARWGGAFTPPLVITVFELLEGWGIPKNMSWRWAFTIFGTFGLVWVGLFAWWFKNKPSQHPGVNAAELELLKGVDEMGGSHAHVPWGKLVRSRTIWLLWLQYFCVSFPWYFFITYLPSYLKEFRHLDQDQIKIYGPIPLLFGGFGCLFAGLIAAKLARWTGSVTFSRRLLSCTGFAGGAIFMLLVTQIENPAWAMLAMGLASFSNDLNMPGAWGSCMDIGGRYAGTVSGSMNMMGNLAGFAAPAIGGYILQHYGGNYNLFLYLMAAMYAVGFFAWPFIDPVTPLEPEDAVEPA
jgi:MFS family permease